MVTLEAVTLIEEESFPLKKLTLQIIPQLEMTLQLQFPPLLALQFQTLTLWSQTHLRNIFQKRTENNNPQEMKWATLLYYYRQKNI